MLKYIRIAFTDPTKNKIKVYSYPEKPGIDTTSTSLSMVGRGYPDYGTKFNENFLHLLENFAYSSSPANPIEGQLWYDTSGSRKTLKVYNNTSWVNVGGLYQQATDPDADGINLLDGDIWVDTDNGTMKVYSSGNWVAVGEETGTGSGVHEFYDAAFTSTNHKVLLNFAEGDVVSIISSVPTFTPTTYLGYTGTNMSSFVGMKIKPGINLGSGYKLYGIVETAENLFVGSDVVPASSFLQKDSLLLQTVTGTVLFETPQTPGQEGRDGVVIRGQENSSYEYVQFYQVRSGVQNSNAAVILNNTEDGKVILQTRLDDEIKNSLVAQGTEVTVQNLTVNGVLALGTGTLQLHSGPVATIPDGWLLCNGSLVLIADYPGLYSRLGSYYGTATGTAFYLPDLSISSTKPTGGTTSTFYIIKT